MASERINRRPALTVVGTGMKYRAHMTLEALDAIEAAEKVFYVAADIMTEKWLQELNPTAERLPPYLPHRPRRETCALWLDQVLGAVRAGKRTCATSYGHPGMLVQFGRDAVRQACQEGYSAAMLPGISALTESPGDDAAHSAS